MRELLVVAIFLFPGCASSRMKIHVPGCAIPISWPDECGPQSYQREFPDRVEFHCVKDVFFEGKLRTSEQVLTYRCMHVHKGDEQK